jgi:hypothetical protein
MSFSRLVVSTGFPLIVYWCEASRLCPLWGVGPRWIIGFSNGYITRRPRLWLRIYRRVQRWAR